MGKETKKTVGDEHEFELPPTKEVVGDEHEFELPLNTSSQPGEAKKKSTYIVSIEFGWFYIKCGRYACGIYPTE